MSMIQNLIKKAFGTSNESEAASFLASACNRMKAMPKDDIHAEVSQALKGVNFARAGEAPKAKAEPQPKAKTIYKDTPETLEKMRKLEAEAAQLRSNLAAADTQRLRELAQLRSTMAQAAPGASEKDVKRAWQEGHNEGWDTGWDAGYKSGCDTTPDSSAEEIAWRDEVIANLEKACDAWESASKLQDLTDANYEKELEECNATIQRLGNEIEGAGFTLKKARDALEESNEEVTRLGRIIDRQAGEKKALQEQIANLERSITSQKKQTQDYNRSYSAAMNQAESYKYQLDAAQKEIETLTAANEELKEDSSYYSKMCGYLQIEIDGLKKRGVFGALFGS